METKIAVIGDRGSIMGFKVVGFDVFEAEKGSSISALVTQLVRSEYGILFVTEELIQTNEDVLDKYKDHMLPAIIPIPGRGGSLGIGLARIHRNVKRAVGTDIFNNG